jgi:hypothetical protein
VATSDTLSFTLNAADAVFTAQLDLSSNSGSATDLLTHDLTPTISGTVTDTGTALSAGLVSSPTPRPSWFL